jgi:hypothetical protein
VIVVVPQLTPVTTPVDMLTVAMAGLELLQTPPAVASVSVIELPGPTDDGPLMAAGLGFTVTAATAELEPVV